jgi:hypothetical protein
MQNSANPIARSVWRTAAKEDGKRRVTSVSGDETQRKVADAGF